MSNQPERDYEELIADQLREAGIKFATEKAIAGLAPDFIVYAPDGRQFIVEVKNWDFPGLTTEASRQGGRCVHRDSGPQKKSSLQGRRYSGWFGAGSSGRA